MFASEDANDVVVLGSYAYVSDGDAGLQVIDVTDPASPQLLGGLDTAHIASDVAVSGNRAYLTEELEDGIESDARIHVLDVSNPAAPQLLGSYYGSGWPFLDFTSPYTRLSIDASGAYCYVAYNGWGRQATGLAVFDASTPSIIRKTGYYTVGTFEPDDPTDVTAAGGYAYMVSHRHLYVFEIDDPTNPVLVGNSGFPGGKGYRSVTVHGDNVFVASGADGLIILNKFTQLRFGPASLQSTTGGIRFQLSGEDGQRVRVQRSANLVDWEDWRIVTLGENGSELIDTIASASLSFYRAIQDDSNFSEP